MGELPPREIPKTAPGAAVRERYAKIQVELRKHICLLDCPTSADSFADQVALELGKSAEQVEDEGTAARGRVDAFGRGPESDAALIKIAHRVDQMAHAASETVELPYDQRFAGMQVIKLRDALGILPLKSAA